MRGSIEFEPSVRVVDLTTGFEREITNVVARLNMAGRISQKLTATTGPDVSEQGWTWQVTERLEDVVNRPPYLIVLPAGTGTVDLTELTPVEFFEPVVLAPPDAIDGGTP
jgi:hypothetical protein